MRDNNERGISVYVHLPFCKSKCGYCGFYSQPSQQHSSEYIEAVLKELSLHQTTADEKDIYTLYIGGGTPSVLPLDRLERLIDSILSRFTKEPDELTIEANPESLSKGLIKTLEKYKGARISLGIQSLNDHALKAAGRAGDAAANIDALDMIKGTSLERFSVDFIAGLPYESPDEFIESISFVLDKYRPPHISLYMPDLSDKTSFAEEWGSLLLNDDELNGLYERMNGCVSGFGLKRYEVSNFAVKGGESKHNLNYWKGGDYIGLGASAAGKINGVRYKNISSIGAYIERVNSGENAFEYSERLNTQMLKREYIFLSLRLSEGLDTKEYCRLFGLSFFDEHNQAIDKNSFALERCGARLRLKDEYVIYADEISADFM